MGLFAIFDCNTAVLHASTIVQATTVYASSAQESQVTTVPTKCRLRALILASNGQCMESMQQPARRVPGSSLMPCEQACDRLSEEQSKSAQDLKQKSVLLIAPQYRCCFIVLAEVPGFGPAFHAAATVLRRVLPGTPPSRSPKCDPWQQYSRESLLHTPAAADAPLRLRMLECQLPVLCARLPVLCLACREDFCS